MTVYIVDLEAVDTRYTAEWKEHLPIQLQRALSENIEVISGGDVPQATTPGAFLNFGGTNVYKSNQLEQMAERCCEGKIKDGDYFLYTDAWNPTVIQLKYMASLLGIDIKIGGMWHAGSYDPEDFLGRLIGDKPWVRNAERSMFECFDHNFFASNFHIEIFANGISDGSIAESYWISQNTTKKKVIRCGWPMEYETSQMVQYKNMEKKDTILFPHRIAPEKQPEIFRDLAESMPEYEFIMCMEKGYSKNDYHNALGEAKLVFSANLQETLGISWYEGLLVDTIPMVPDRVSYSEMAHDQFKYPSEWTESWDKYQKYKPNLIEVIKTYIEGYSQFLPAIKSQTQKLSKDYFGGTQLYNMIKDR